MYFILLVDALRCATNKMDEPAYGSGFAVDAGHFQPRQFDVYEEGLYPTVPTADIMMIIMYQ